MTFPRKKDNSLDIVAFEKLDEEAQMEALVELRANGTPEEINKVKGRFLVELGLEKRRAKGLEGEVGYLRGEASVLEDEVESLRNEIAVLENQKTLIYSKMPSGVREKEKEEKATKKVSSSDVDADKPNNNGYGCNIF